MKTRYSEMETKHDEKITKEGDPKRVLPKKTAKRARGKGKKTCARLG